MHGRNKWVGVWYLNRVSFRVEERENKDTPYWHQAWQPLSVCSQVGGFHLWRESGLGTLFCDKIKEGFLLLGAQPALS